MSDTPMSFPCKDVGSPDKEQRQKLQRLVGITDNNAETICCTPILLYTADRFRKVFVDIHPAG